MVIDKSTEECSHLVPTDLQVGVARVLPQKYSLLACLSADVQLVGTPFLFRSPGPPSVLPGAWLTCPHAWGYSGRMFLCPCLTLLKMRREQGRLRPPGEHSTLARLGGWKVYVQNELFPSSQKQPSALQMQILT